MTNGPAEQDSASCRVAWATLYDRYSVGVWRYVARIVGSDSDAVADAVQETFLAAARNFHQFDSTRGTEWSWLAGIAHRQAALHWRRVGREQLNPVPIEEILSEEATTDLLERAETVEAVRRVLAELPAESATILTGKYCDGLAVSELVEQLGGTTESVRSKLARARREFKKHIELSTAGREAADVTRQNP